MSLYFPVSIALFFAGTLLGRRGEMLQQSLSVGKSRREMRDKINILHEKEIQ
jgi:hypothetical protein